MHSPARSSPEGPVPPLIVICGATATGKTALSLSIAERLPRAEIVSADSRQVYRGMDIGTAKASAAERARVPQHGLDLVAPDQAFTAADYQGHASEALTGIAEGGGVALLVGGTGLYIRAVARGLPLAETGHDAEARTRLETRLAGEGLHSLVADLRSHAPTVAASTDLANPRRVVRALERVAIAGDAPPPAPRGYPGRVLWLGLQSERAPHAARIADRARGQFESGLLDEAAELGRRFDHSLPAFTAFGYREAFAVLDGSLGVEEAIERTAMRTRQFARRQATWFRAEPGVRWIDAEDPLPAALELVREFLGG